MSAAAAHHPEPTTTAPGPLRVDDLLTVVAGGAVGSLSRYGVGLLLPATGVLDWPLLTVNIVGALCLGLLLGGLTRHSGAGADPPSHRRLRLLLGTGFLGGLTTYSALAVGALDPIGTSVRAVLQLVLIVVGGVVAAGAGMLLGTRVMRSRS